MTRRTFLKSLSVAGAGVAAGLSILPTKAKEVPLWATAGYEPERPHPEVLRAEEEFWREYESHFYDLSTPEKMLQPIAPRFRLIDGEWRRAEWA